MTESLLALDGYTSKPLGQGTTIKAAFLYDGTRSLFEKCGFTFERTKGTKNCVVRTTVAPGPRFVR